MASGRCRRFAQELEQRSPQRRAGFLWEEVATRHGSRAEVNRPVMPDLTCVGELSLRGARNQEDRASDTPSSSPIGELMLSIEPEARAVVTTDRGDRRSVQRLQIEARGPVLQGPGFLAPGVEDEAEEELAVGGEQTFWEWPRLGEQEPGPVAQ